MTHNFGVPETARELVSRWDSGETIWSIEMGGLGPGYEQAIQILAVEITRDNLDKPVPNPAPSDWGYDTCERIDKPLPNGKYSCGGFSGAQVGAARQIAYKWLTVGPRAAYDTFPEDRRIQVSKFFPRVAE